MGKTKLKSLREKGIYSRDPICTKIVWPGSRMLVSAALGSFPSLWLRIPAGCSSHSAWLRLPSSLRSLGTLSMLLGWKKRSCRISSCQDAKAGGSAATSVLGRVVWLAQCFPANVGHFSSMQEKKWQKLVKEERGASPS